MRRLFLLSIAVVGAGVVCGTELARIRGSCDAHPR